MNLKQAELIRSELEKRHPMARLKELAAVVSNGKDDMAELIEAREALDEHIKSLRVKSAFECLSEYSEEEIEEATQRLKKQGRI